MLAFVGNAQPIGVLLAEPVRNFPKKARCATPESATTIVGPEDRSRETSEWKLEAFHQWRRPGRAP